MSSYYILVQAVSAFQIASQHNPQNTEVSRKIKRLTQLAREQKRAGDVENMRSNIDLGKNLGSLKTELVSFMITALCGIMNFGFPMYVASHFTQNATGTYMKVWKHELISCTSRHSMKDLFFFISNLYVYTFVPCQFQFIGTCLIRL
jgi:hypothetical protein